ncbi:helix-turn-helix domain-containing protein [Lacrimispora sp. JR3]|uniref:helix-turn-helix domain-containing protein n=1 Tax=Lacrimispora sinapis TaxID=3111456 RepID=UPI003749ACF3
MTHIGIVIRNFREKMGLSRIELAQQICSEKYLYLIETGKRSPSSHILYLFGEKLHEDLFIYYRYLDCKDPISVCQFISKFNLCRQKGDYITLKEFNAKAKDLADFKKDPWKIQIFMNEISIQIFLERKYENCIEKISKYLSNTSSYPEKSKTKTRLYILLSICYTMIGNSTKAHEATMEAASLLPESSVIYQDQTHIAAHINLLTSYYLIKNYEDACRKGTSLIRYMSDFGFYDRLLIPYFFTAFAYYHISDFENAFFYFTKGIHFSLANFNPLDVYDVSVQDMFFLMLHDSRMNAALVKEFLEEYGTYISQEQE